MNKKIIALFVGFTFVLLTVVIFKFGFRKKTEFKIVKVERRNVFEEILESGIVEKGKETRLSFKNGGKIEKIFVDNGKTVKFKESLAKLETQELELQLKEAELSLKMAQNNLEKLLAGATFQEKELAQKELEVNENSFLSAQKSLDDSFEQGRIVINNVYIALYNSLNFLKEFVQKYVKISDADTRKIILARDKIEEQTINLNLQLEILKTGKISEKIENVLLMAKKSLEVGVEELENTRKIIEESSYLRENVLFTDKTSLDAQKINLNQKLSATLSVLQTISLTKSNFDIAKAKVEMAKAKLDLITSPPRQNEINLYEIQIEQAKIKIDLLKKQLEEATLKSPFNGKIVKILKREGEIVQPIIGDFIFVILPESQFQIRADIYEKDIVKIKEGADVEITFVAFPNEIFKGKVSFIEPASKIKEGIVYYEVVIEAENLPSELRAGMTCDVKIKTSVKNNVLALPRDAIKKDEGKYLVEILKNGKIEKREVQLGIGEEIVEIISGLKEGEEIVLR